MQRIQLVKWFLLILILFCIPLLCLPMPMTINKLNLDVDPSSYSNLIDNLRDNWQSPITYLKKRGYIPVLNEHYDEKRSNPAVAASATASASASASHFSEGQSRAQPKGQFAGNDYAYDKAIRVRGDDLLDSLYKRAHNSRAAPAANPKNPKNPKDQSFIQNMKDKFFGFFGKKDLDKTQFSFNLKTDPDTELKVSSGNNAGDSIDNEKIVFKNSANSVLKSLVNNQRQLYETSNQMDRRYMEPNNCLR